MAKVTTEKPSKSAKVREALAANPDKPVAELAKELKVTPGLIYNIKATGKRKSAKAKVKRGRKPGHKAGANGAAPASAHNALDSAFEFVSKVGGLMHAEQLIGKLKAIKERL